MTIRNMVVVRAPSTTNCPMVRIANRMLKLHGFTIGVPIEVAYAQNIITLRILDHANKLQSSPSPLSIPAASGTADAEENTRHAGRGKSNSADVTEAVSAQPKSVRLILSRYWSNVGA